MTKEQREMAETMLESGCTYTQVARNLGYSREYICKLFRCQKYSDMRMERSIKASKCPVLKHWLYENDMTVQELADACYVSRATIQNIFTKGKISVDTLEQVCRVTGMAEENLLQK